MLSNAIDSPTLDGMGQVMSVQSTVRLVGLNGMGTVTVLLVQGFRKFLSHVFLVERKI